MWLDQTRLLILVLRDSQRLKSFPEPCINIVYTIETENPNTTMIIYFRMYGQFQPRLKVANNLELMEFKLININHQ